MAVIEIPQSTRTDNMSLETMTEMMNQVIHPDNPNVNLQSFDDVLDCMFLCRSKLAELFNSNLEELTAGIRQEEREKIRAEINERLEKACMRRNRYQVKTQEDVKDLARALTLYETLIEKPMSRDAFAVLAKERKVSPDMAEAVYRAATLNPELMRKVISENMVLLSE